MSGECTARCWEMPYCSVCGLRKRPIGRDPGAAASSYCNPDCDGFDEAPTSGHLWPGEHAKHCATWDDEACDCEMPGGAR